MKNSVAQFFDKYAVDFNLIYGGKNNFLNNFVNNHLRKSMKIRFIIILEYIEMVL